MTGIRSHCSLALVRVLVPAALVLSAGDARAEPIFEQTLRQSAALSPGGGLLGLVDAVVTSKPNTDIKEENVLDKNNCILGEGCLGTSTFPVVKIVDGTAMETDQNLVPMVFSFFLSGAIRDEILNTPNSFGRLTITASRDLGRNRLPGGGNEAVGEGESIPVVALGDLLGRLFHDGPASLNNCPPNPPGNVNEALNVVDPTCGLNGHTDVRKSDTLGFSHDRLVALIIGSGGAEPGPLEFLLDLDATQTPGRLKIFAVNFVVNAPQPSALLLLGAAAPALAYATFRRQRRRDRLDG